MASEPYHWCAHQAAVEVLVRFRQKERKGILDMLQRTCNSPFDIESQIFTLPNEAPFHVVAVESRVLTLQIDHAAKEVLLLALE